MLPWWWSPQRMMSNSVSESEKEILTGCVSFYTQWFDVCVCIRVRGLHLVKGWILKRQTMTLPRKQKDKGEMTNN